MKINESIKRNENWINEWKGEFMKKKNDGMNKWIKREEIINKIMNE